MVAAAEEVEVVAVAAEGMISTLLTEKTSSNAELEDGDSRVSVGFGFLGFRPLFPLVSPISES